MPTYCAVCPNETQLGCDACKAVLFCSRQCQKLIWKTHKLICGERVDTFEHPKITQEEWDYFTSEWGFTGEQPVRESKSLLDAPQSEKAIEIEDHLFQLLTYLWICKVGVNIDAIVRITVYEHFALEAGIDTEQLTPTDDVLPPGFLLPLYYLAALEFSLQKRVLSRISNLAPSWTNEKEESRLWDSLRLDFNVYFRHMLIEATIYDRHRKASNGDTRDYLKALYRLAERRCRRILKSAVVKIESRAQAGSLAAILGIE